MKTTMLISLLAVLLSACAPVAAQTSTAVPILPTATLTDIYWPTEGWRTSTPEEQGMDSQKLDAMLAEINERKIAVHSLLIIRNGYLVSETYFEPYQQDLKQDMQSVGRSFTSVLIGIAIDKGYIDGVDHQVLDYFPEHTFANLDEQKKAMTLEDVLTMRSGLEGENDPYYQAMQNSPDWIQYLLDKPIVDPPGSRWSYCAGCSHILTVILQEINRHESSRLCGAKPVQAAGHFSWILDDRSSMGLPTALGDLILRHATWPSWDTSIFGTASGMGSRSFPPSGWRPPRGLTRM